MLFGGIQLNYKLITKNGSSVDEAILQTIQVVTTPFIFENIVCFFFRVTDSAELWTEQLECSLMVLTVEWRPWNS